MLQEPYWILTTEDIHGAKLTRKSKEGIEVNTRVRLRTINAARPRLPEHEVGISGMTISRSMRSTQSILPRPRRVCFEIPSIKEHGLHPLPWLCGTRVEVQPIWNHEAKRSSRRAISGTWQKQGDEIGLSRDQISGYSAFDISHLIHASRIVEVGSFSDPCMI